MVDIKPWPHAEHVNPMPHGGFDVAHHIPILDHPAKEPTHAASPSCCRRTTGLWQWSNKLIPFWTKYIGVRLSSPVFSLQLCQQRLRLLEVGGVKALAIAMWALRLVPYRRLKSPRTSTRSWHDLHCHHYRSHGLSC